MKKITKFLSILCSVCMIMTITITTYAADLTNDVSFDDVYGVSKVSEPELTPEEEELRDKLQNMSTDELNAFIHQIAIGEEKANGIQVSSSSSLRAAWIAAALIAKQAGYTCAGTLVEYSAYGDDYSETNSIFSEKILTTDAYSNWANDFSEPSIEFTKSDNADLFYSLHKAYIDLVSSSSQGALIRVTDVFDFAFSSDMGDLFSTLVNDWGWLSQQMGALTPIDVTITFNS